MTGTRWACVLACLFGLGSAALAAAPGSPAAAKPTPVFEKDVRPIFRAHCFDCHGAGDEHKGGLDLRLVRFLRRGGESGPAIMPGRPDESYLLERVRASEMPPGDKHLSPDEVSTLERWIAAGAPTARPEPEAVGPGLGITPEDRAYWAFQSIRRPEVPEFPADNGVRTPIDALLRASMPDGLSFSPDARRATLAKRAYLDLTGLPPEPEDMRRVLTDSSSDWYERLIDTLLDSPHYGEHWARHWLDVAGYADSEGYTVSDTDRPWAWKYRDYVIRSLNADKPLDRFIIEQLAGDELAGPRNGDLTLEQIELLSATGFLRMAADGTGSGADTAEARNQVMSDTIKIVSTSLLGMSVACAQCHDHRYDPILQSDYYAMRAIFEPALDWRHWQVPQQRLISLYTENDRAKAAQVEAEAQRIAAERNEKQSKYLDEALEAELQKYEPALRDSLRAAYKTSGDKRTAAQNALLKQYPSVNISPGVLYQYLPKAADELKEYDKRIAEVRAGKPREEFLRVLAEPSGHAPETRLFHRGDYQQPRHVVQPGDLTVIAPDGERREIPADDPQLPTTGRRLAYARLLVSGQHPLLARVLVNRVWLHHFGRAIVETPGDFGRLGVPPTHPDLLDWLADELVSHGWSLKHLHRLILTSTVFRQSSAPDPRKEALDPENRSYWRKPLVRLEAETLRDRMLAAAGVLDRSLFGPPLAIKEDETGQVVVDGQQKRRSLYIRVRRSQPVAMLQAFDAPVMETNCDRRSTSTVATQSLMLMNGEFILAQSANLADRACRDAISLTPDSLAALDVPASQADPPPGSTEEQDEEEEEESAERDSRDGELAGQATRAWQLALCRQPDRTELRTAISFLNEQIRLFEQHPDRLPKDVTGPRQAMTNLCQVLLSSNEFLYLD